MRSPSLKAVWCVNAGGSLLVVLVLSRLGDSALVSAIRAACWASFGNAIGVLHGMWLARNAERPWHTDLEGHSNRGGR